MVQVIKERDTKITDFGKAVLEDRYLINGEGYQDLFARVSKAYSNNEEHAQRIYDYISNMWFMPATPILANGGTTRGLPISCFLNETEDSLNSIAQLWNENVYLASSGGGIGSFIGNIRSINETITGKGHTSGVIPFIKVIDSMTLAISQGSLRRGSAAVYMNDTHPEIEEFIDIRRPTGGDTNRRCLNIHHGVCLSDAFMEAVQTGKPWELKSPATGKVVNTINPRDLWIRILASRVETGEPYILYTDTVNKNSPEVYKKNNFKVKTSNLCSEITLLTGKDHLQQERTAVCCLSSLNLEYYEEWKNDATFIEDIMNFLDNVLQDFIDRAPDSMARAKYSAMRERSVGLGVMGFHSFLQSKMTPIEGVAAKSWNKQIFAHIKEKCDAASKKIAQEKGACPDAKDAGLEERFSHKIAIAPTASISIIAGNASPGIEPFLANCYTHKTLSGSFIVRNKYLKKLLKTKACDNDSTWSSIAMNEGSVQHLDCLTPEEKDVFKTAMEVNQMWLIDHAADRQPFICQAQSLNVFVPSNIEKKTLHEIHFQAWKKNVKSLYYCRSASIQRAEKVPAKQDIVPEQPKQQPLGTVIMQDDDCLACQ
jgi:ribonucleoside-diphosphate reductase alpha chain